MTLTTNYMRKYICSVTACLLLTVFSYSQNKTFSRKELGDLDLRIRNFVAGLDNVFSEERKSEFAQLMIETDSSGRVKEIHSAGTDTDSIYKIFKKMTPQDFGDWKGPNNKSIIIPFFYLSGHSSKAKNYIDVIFQDYYKKIPGNFIVSESGNTIVYKWLMSVTPMKPRNEY